MATERLDHVDINLISSPVGSERDEERARTFVKSFLKSKGWQAKVRPTGHDDVVRFDHKARKR